MHCYKALHPFTALSFDLDDTLYHNGPVIERAELAMQRSLLELAPQLGQIDADFWWQQRKSLAAAQPEVRHDVSQWRLLGLRQGLLLLGLPLSDVNEVAAAAFNAFYLERSNLEVPASSHQLLAALADKYPLVSITNGNADVHRLGIAHYFRHHLRAGPDGRMKPYPDLFENACQLLNIPPSQLLHIGDNAKADVQGALAAGCQAIWLQLPQQQTRLLPQIRISALDQLELLL
ncbi:HAD-IA family hydrolase [Rheinheimera sp.]|uniref:HAD-IA family hydrolase n=1 Tax=Rheinheimera sp. TaxID=1869214 RepID=UPI003AF80091